MENKKLITAEDLMVGDWVSVSGTPMRIAVFGTVKAVFLDAKGEIFCHGYDSIEPIPLTKEILVNNGFERIDTTIGNYALSIYVENEYDENDYSTREFYRIGTYLAGGYFDGMFEIENRKQEEYTSCKRRCKYVHELQHALKLCGINKEIKLN